MAQNSIVYRLIACNCIIRLDYSPFKRDYKLIVLWLALNFIKLYRHKKKHFVRVLYFLLNILILFLSRNGLILLKFPLFS